MANEIKKSIRLSINNSTDRSSFGGSNKVADQATAAPAVRVQSLTLQASTSDTALTFGGMAAGNLGEVLFENLSTTAGQYITIGPDNAGAIFPAFRVYPGQQASVQLIPSMTYRFQAAAGTPNAVDRCFGEVVKCYHGIRSGNDRRCYDAKISELGRVRASARCWRRVRVQTEQSAESPVATPAPTTQRLMFDVDPNRTKKMFEDALFDTAKQAKKKKRPADKPATPSLLEKIEGDLKKMHDESKPLGGQKEFFSRMLHSAVMRFARKKPDESKGRWVTLHGSHVFVVNGKIAKGPSHLVGKTEGDISPADKKRAVRSKSIAGEWVVEKDPKWKNFRIPSVKFKEWVEADEPEVKIPKSKRGAAIYDAAKKAADDAELPFQDVVSLMPDAHKHLKLERQQREKAKAELRRVSGLTAGSIARMENKYLDHSSLKNWDTTAREFAMNHAELGFDPESHETPAKLWDFIREGVLPYIASFHPAVAELAAEWARPKRLAKDERLPGDEDEHHEPIESRSGEAVPFSRRSAIVEKFSRAFLLSVHDLLQAQIRRAASETDMNPSYEQRQAGNYRKGKFRWNGLTIAIENPVGSVRSGKSADGVAWSTEMKSHYGYILRNISEADGDHVDVFVGPCPESDLVCVVDQNNKDGLFDEHKVMIGFVSADEAKAAYLSNYSDDWTGFGSITAMTAGQFLEWLNCGDTGRVVSKQVSRYSRVAIVQKFSRIFQKHQNLPLRSF